jgi:hypothetical protein
MITHRLHLPPVSERRTFGYSEPEQVTQRKSKRPIEGLVCIAWFCIFWLRAVHPVKDKNLGYITDSQRNFAETRKTLGKPGFYQRRGQEPNCWAFSLCFVIVRKVQIGRSNLAKIPAAGHFNCTNPLQARMCLFRFGPTHDPQTQVLPSWYLVVVSVAIPS